MTTLPGCAELNTVSHFRFFRGASHPQERVAQAALGYRALLIVY